MEPIVVYQSRGKLVVILLGSFAFDVIGVLMLAQHPASMGAKTILTVKAVAAISFFSACGLFALYRLLWRKPAIRIDSDGLTDNASASSVGFIPWSDITGARIVVQSTRRSRQKFLGVALRNPNDYLARCGPLTRLLFKANQRLTGYLVNIPQAALSMRLEALMEHIEFYRQRSRDGKSF